MSFDIVSVCYVCCTFCPRLPVSEPVHLRELTTLFYGLRARTRYQLDSLTNKRYCKQSLTKYQTARLLNAEFGVRNTFKPFLHANDDHELCCVYAVHIELCGKVN